MPLKVQNEGYPSFEPSSIGSTTASVFTNFSSFIVSDSTNLASTFSITFLTYFYYGLDCFNSGSGFLSTGLDYDDVLFLSREVSPCFELIYDAFVFYVDESL
jgi:hypothetical protein